MNRNERAEFAQRLRARFEQLADEEGWTQDTWADSAGVPLRTVSDVYRGVSRYPNATTLKKLGAAVGLDPTASEARARWSEETQSLLNVVGMFLEALPEEERREVMRDITARVVAPRGQSK